MKGGRLGDDVFFRALGRTGFLVLFALACEPCFFFLFSFFLRRLYL
jgi:hypothetical protein